MARFRFPLQRLLEHRLREEREKQHAVAECETERARIEDEIRRRQRSITAFKSDLRDSLAGGATGRFDVTSVRLQANASLSMVFQTQQLAIQLAGVHRRLDAARAELLEKTTQRRAVELLRDRQFEEWRRDQLKREFRELDEIAMKGVAARRMVDEEAWR